MTRLMFRKVTLAAVLQRGVRIWEKRDFSLTQVINEETKL